MPAVNVQETQKLEEIMRYGLTLDDVRHEVRQAMMLGLGPQHQVIAILNDVQRFQGSLQVRDAINQWLSKACWILNHLHEFEPNRCRPDSDIISLHKLSDEYLRAGNVQLAYLVRDAAIALEKARVGC